MFSTFVLTTGVVVADPGDLINWVKYDDALSLAKKQNKHVIVNFTTSWCGWCKKMKASTYIDSAVVRMIKSNFVAAKVDGDSYGTLNIDGGQITERGLTIQYGVSGYPTTWFLEPDGKRIAPAPGFIDVNAMRTILDYVGNNFNDDMAFTEYLTQQKKLETVRPNNKIKLGMTSHQVKKTWGEPTKIAKTASNSGPTEEWFYVPNQFLTMKNGVLRGYQEREASASAVNPSKVGTQ